MKLRRVPFATKTKSRRAYRWKDSRIELPFRRRIREFAAAARWDATAGQSSGDVGQGAAIQFAAEAARDEGQFAAGRGRRISAGDGVFAALTLTLNPNLNPNPDP